MANIFQVLTNQIKNSKFVLIVGIFSLLMLIIGINHFVEDYESSRRGLIDIESSFGIIPVIFSWTYVTMSLTPQVAQIVFAYMYLSDTRKYRWAFIAAFISFCIDFFADLWYRSDSNPFESWERFLMSSALTLAFFTIGSEAFITAGGGLLLELTSPFIIQIRLLLQDIGFALSKDALKHINRAQKRPNLSNSTKITNKRVTNEPFKRTNVRNNLTNEQTNPFSRLNWSKIPEKSRTILNYAKHTYEQTKTIPGPTEVSNALYGKPNQKGFVSETYKKYKISLS